MSEKTKVYVTKWALTEGIFKKECNIEGNTAIYMSEHGYTQHLNNSPDYFEWHYTLNEARFYAENMRLKRIASLKRRIKKLERMRF